MNFLQQIYPGDAIASFVVRVLAEITLIAFMAIFFGRTVAGRNPAMRHGICVCALLCVMVAPFTTWGLEQMGWRTFQISLDHDKSPLEASTSRSSSAAIISEAGVEPTFWTIERARGTASFLILIWMSGTGLMLVRIVLGAKKVERIRKSCRTISHPKLEAAVRSLSGEAFPTVPIQFTTRLNSPVVVGPRNTTVILPEKLLETLNEQQLRCVLAHELTHVRQHDPLVGLLQRFVEAGYWPHPLVHLLNQDLVRAREEVCDNVALHGTTPPAYATTLLTVALGSAPRRPTPGTIGLMTRPWRLEERVKGLLDPSRRLTTTMNTRHLAMMSIALASGTALIAGAHVVAAPYPPSGQDTLDLYAHVDSKTHAVKITPALQKSKPAKSLKIDNVLYVTADSVPAVNYVPKNGPKKPGSVNHKVTLKQLSVESYPNPNYKPVKGTHLTMTKAEPAVSLKFDSGPQELHVGGGQTLTITGSNRLSNLSKHDQVGQVEKKPAQLDGIVLDESNGRVFHIGTSIRSVNVVSSKDFNGAQILHVVGTKGQPAQVTNNPAQTIKIGDGKEMTVTLAEPAVQVAGIKEGQVTYTVSGTANDTTPNTVYTIVTDGKGRPTQVNSVESRPRALKSYKIVSKDGVSGYTVRSTHTIHGDPVISMVSKGKLQFSKATATDRVNLVYTKQAKSADKTTYVYIDGGHVKVIGDNIKVIYGKPNQKKK